MTFLKARSLSLDDVHRLLGLQPLYNGSFTPLLTLEALTERERQELREIQNEFRSYWSASKVSEGQVRLLSLAPLLRLAGYNRPPIRLDIEEEIDRIYLEDGETYVSGRFDIVAVHKEQPAANPVPLWILVVESKESKADVSTGLPQLLAYAFKSLERQAFVWGLVTNGGLYQFIYLCQNPPPTYQFMPILSFLEDDRAVQILQVLKAIRQL